MDDYEEMQAKKNIIEFFWTTFGPDACHKCGQQFWSDQTKFFKHKKNGGLYARCVHCQTLHRFSLSMV
jgi:RNase P subunit RPR2